MRELSKLGRKKREGVHTKKTGLCRSGGGDKVPEYDSSPPDVLRNKAKYIEATKIHSFLAHIKWRAEEGEETGRLTWLGLYLLYARHGGNEDGRKG